jgi:methionyl-tRNA formyltransferase
MKTDNRRYVFIGNRYYVYQKMVELNLNIVKIYAVKDSFLSRYLDSKRIEYTELGSKKSLIDDLMRLEFDLLVSNGCRYILPISELKMHLQTKGIQGDFINVHTSLLPDCKGRHPVNAAILFGRRHGVTCHRMDDGIDTGGIIEQTEIPITDDVSLNLLYKLSFMAEGDVFEKAYRNNFVEKKSIVCDVEPIYYSRSEDDLYIYESDDLLKIKTKVRAFSAKGMYAKISVNDEIVCIANCRPIQNPYLLGKYDSSDNRVYLTYSNSMIAGINGTLFDLEIANVGDLLLPFDAYCGMRVDLKRK